jgi:tRNA_anti-like
MFRNSLTIFTTLIAVFFCRGDDANVVKVVPEAFAVEVKKDEKAAAAKYKGKTVEMTEKVQGINRNASGDVFLSLPSKTAGLLGVSCFLMDKNVFCKVVKGQEVTVRGRYPDFQFGVQIIDCTLVKTGESPALTYTAEEFAKEWAKDKDAAAKKWKDKQIILTGLIVESKVNDVGAVNIYLKAAGKDRVDCGFSAFEKDLATKLQTGERVKVVGEFQKFDSKDGPVLRFCFPASK